ncbi:hypothetical protein [Natrialbaceae archaeon AArc-T1-2]|uniref:hypothetical protein n=1 Tax=Natrialbaceae archaeon AArc-T1-2 TaxID=3053904 RepID=UPI00255ABB4C|nr:hypothetical protein [Natrialbaceae archaeon AArc-T1-2]WIV67045.1 hypothetical protein QQ977_15375 [Natrialbaceae archaeon AArc-T1-2]
MTSRKNAMLTTEDRRWLTGEKSYEGEHAKQQRYQRRRDIRQRIYSTILDFTLLVEHLEEAERSKLFEGVDDRGLETDDDEAFTNGLRDGLAFILYSTGITEAMIREGPTESEPLAEQLLADAVYRAGKRDGILVEDVDLTVEATRASVAAVLSDLKAGNDVSPAELRLLIESDRIDTADVQDCLREVIVDEE